MFQSPNLNLKKIDVGGIEFNDYRFYDDLDVRCHMIHAIDNKAYRCTEVATHELIETEIDHFNGHKIITHKYCDQHTIQLKISNQFKNKEFIKINDKL